MRRWAIRLGIAAQVVIAMASASIPEAQATVSGSGMCWVPDWEFPIPCADIDED